MEEESERTAINRTSWSPIWSSSRSRWMQSCPRRFIMQYVAGHGGRISTERPQRWLWRQGRWASPRELLQRSVRDTLRKWLSEAHLSVHWTPEVARKELQDCFLRSIDSQQSEMTRMQKQLRRPVALFKQPSQQSIEKNIEKGNLMLRRAYNHPLLGELLKCSFQGEWQPLDPFITTHTDNGPAYLSPDLIIKGPRRWVLIRISAASWRAMPDEVGMVELAGMIHWAIQENTLPDSPKEYEIARISHTEKGWQTWRRPADKQMLEEARRLISHDLKEARYLVNRAGPMLNLEHIPLADKAWRCRSCGYRFTCPGGSNLQRAKMQQSASERNMLGLASSLS